MTKILITEFINQNSLEKLNKKFDVKYDEKLCENKIEIEKIIEAGHHHGSTYYEHLAFLKAIESTSASEVSLEDGLIAVAVGEAAEKSIKERRLINLEEIIN